METFSRKEIKNALAYCDVSEEELAESIDTITVPKYFLEGMLEDLRDAQGCLQCDIDVTRRLLENLERRLDMLSCYPEREDSLQTKFDSTEWKLMDYMLKTHNNEKIMKAVAPYVEKYRKENEAF